MRRFLHIFSWIIVGLLILSPDAGFGQKITRMDIYIYPEYYTPGVMVEFNGEVTEAESDELYGLRIPTETDSAFSVIEIPEQESVVRPLDITAKNGESWMMFPSHQGKFRVFAFFNPFSPDSEERVFSLDIKSDHDFPEFHIFVQQPLRAQEFDIQGFSSTPEPQQDQHGITFQRFHNQPLAAGESRSVTVQYNNPTGELSIDALQTMLGNGDVAQQPNQQQNPHSQAPIRHKLPMWQPLLILGIIAVFAGLYIREKIKSPAKGTQSVSDSTEPISTGTSEEKSTETKHVSEQAEKRFCRNCGTEVSPEDNFCHSCGTKL